MKDTKKIILELDEETEQLIIKSIENYRGVGTTLESALGSLIIGQHFGWRVLKMLHNPATYKKYEKILGIEYKDVCLEITDMGKKKSIGYAISEKLGSFWAIITGKKKIPDKGVIESPEKVIRRLEEMVQEEDK